MKNKIIISIIIGLMCFVLLYVMSIQIRTIEKTDLTSIKTMREVELRTELSNWKTKYEEIVLKHDDVLSKIEEYKEITETDKEAVGLLNEEIAHSKMVLGQTGVQGPGIIVTLQDTEDAQMEDVDIVLLVNELRMAGAEAISINEKRIISRSDIRVAGYHILVNTEIIASPYVIKAIGDPDYLQSQLIIKDGYIDRIKKEKEGIGANVEKIESIIIPKYNREIELKYAI